MSDIQEIKKAKSFNELKAEIIEQKKNQILKANKRLKDLEKKEKETRLKPYFKLVEKHLHNISDKDLETMSHYILSRFGEKK